MTIEQKALELDLIARVIGAYHTTRLSGADVNAHILGKPHVREAFDRLAEADKSRHAAELREQAERFSEAAKEAIRRFREGSEQVPGILSPFILAPVDPLVEALTDCGLVFDDGPSGLSKQLRAALEARGLAIVKKEAANG